MKIIKVSGSGKGVGNENYKMARTDESLFWAMEILIASCRRA